LKLRRKVLGEFVGYVVDIMPYTKWGKLMYSIKIMMMGLSSLASQNLEELLDWLWYGSALTLPRLKPWDSRFFRA